MIIDAREIVGKWGENIRLTPENISDDIRFVRLQADYDKLSNASARLASQYVPLAIKMVTEAMGNELQVDRLLEPRLVRPESFVKAFVGSLEKLDIKHPFGSLPAMREYVRDKRYPGLRTFLQYVRDHGAFINEFKALMNELREIEIIDE